ncbi:MAG TPA: tripartite tricarboxylate transporter substrate binding protein [Burkholderiales bacterium]|jgi:tripartite-type tricarboxylate transporter receptor subunit TctC|nr:tripartite tricarboxylate transporter substrate binding protein [Burkholderiales bacterium]
MKAIVQIFAFSAACILAGPCDAQDWPGKPVRLVVPFAPAGPADIVARLLGQKLSEYLGQQVLVDNRAGAGGNIGATAVAKSSPDGYTALVTTSAFAVNVSLFPNAGYDAERDFIPTGAVASQPNMIFVNTSLPVKTLAELFSLAKTSKLAYASPGSGTTPHLTGENLFNVVGKLNMTPIHFRGAGPAVVAVVAGEPPVGSMAISGPLPQIKAGRLRALAVSSARRNAALPEVPTFAEAGFPGIEDYTWIGVFLPAGTPLPVVHKLNEAINRAIQAPDFRERLDANAFDPLGGSQQQFAEYVKVEIAKWRKVVRETGARPD